MKSQVNTTSLPPISSSFVTNEHKSSIHNPSYDRQHLLSPANDWKLLVDLHHLPIIFPSEICVSNQRPDIIIWSLSSKTVFLIELSCPSEEGIIAANIRKNARYIQLAKRISSKKWNCTIIPFEVGARGFVAKSMYTMLRKIGFAPRIASKLCKTCSLTAAFCSYSIWNHRKEKSWTNRTLFRPTNPDN